MAASVDRLTVRLHSTFCRFQLQAKNIAEWVEATQTPVDTGMAREILEEYSQTIGSEIKAARDDLRNGRWADSASVHLQHDTLCFCIAVWELVHEMVVSSRPSAARLLHWYNRHYLDEDLAAWWQSADAEAEDSAAIKAEDSAFWRSTCRLALSDCHAEVLELLQRKAADMDPHVARVCEFLQRTPSLKQMDEARATPAEFRKATDEVKEAARMALRDLPTSHPVRQLMEVFAGSSNDSFERGEDVAQRQGRTWIEDMVYSHAWVFPTMRRADLQELLRAVARRRTSETIDDLDRVLFTVLTLDVPALLELLPSLPDRFPVIFVTHLVDVLYFAGRVPPSAVPGGGAEDVPPRDWHLMAHAKELLGGESKRQHTRFAMDYLRACGSGAASELLRATAKDFCNEAETDADMEEALSLLMDLDLAGELGVSQCQRHGQQLLDKGDLGSCLRWYCRAEGCRRGAAAILPLRGFGVSELLDQIAQQDLDGLMALLAPPPSEISAEALPLGQQPYPPRSLIALLGGASGTLPPSGRLYFFSQLAHWHALKRSGMPMGRHALALVRLLCNGVVPPFMVDAVVDELLPLLRDEESPSPLAAEEVLLLMRFLQAALTDPLQRTRLSNSKVAELNTALGNCLSCAVMSSGPPSRIHGAAQMVLTESGSGSLELEQFAAW